MPLNKKVARACYKHETKTLVDKWISKNSRTPTSECFISNHINVKLANCINHSVPYTVCHGNQYETSVYRSTCNISCEA